MPHSVKQWRLAALTDPSLWSDLTCVKGKWLERFITLSKASPLAFHYSAKPSDALKDPFLDRPERLGEAYLPNCTDTLLGRLNKATPFLSSLALSGVFSFRDEHHLPIPDNFLAGSAPRLHTFHMSSCTIPLRPSWLCNVQSLTLIGKWGIRSTLGQQEQLTISSFLEFIKPLKALAKLQVDLRQPQEPADNTYTGPTIRFAHLHSIHLDLGDGFLSSVELLSHIEAPSLAFLEVVWPHHIFSSMEIDAVANASLNATDLIHQFFTKNTGASLSRLEWSVNDVHSNVILSSSESNPPCSITLYNILISVLNIPFEDVKSIRTVEIGTSEALMTLDDTSDFAFPWPFLDRVEVPAFALIPKNKCLPALKRWLKIRTGIRDLKIIGLERLSERDVQPLEKILDVEWVW
ncbi:hypothetical protein ONZ45_g18846 [Pleurotus djamor]|nr:hypothetical protein ONZ45_g18846 [Pleurotus djamor]